MDPDLDRDLDPFNKDQKFLVQILFWIWIPHQFYMMKKVELFLFILGQKIMKNFKSKLIKCCG